MTKKIDDLLDDLEDRAKAIELSHDIIELQKEVLRLRKIVESYGLEEEMHITNIEYICQKELDNLKHQAMVGGLTSDQAKVFDLLHKNLRMARGHVDKKEVPTKSLTEGELLKLVKGDE